MSLEPGTAPRRIAPGCWRIVLPDPYPPGAVAVFLLEGEDAPWLVDAGPPGEEAAAGLDRGLEAVGLERAALRGVLLSHGHLDHAGGLADWSPPILGAHAAAVERLRDRQADGRARADQILRRAGLPAEERRRLREYREPRDPALARSLAFDRRLEGEAGGLDGPAGWRWRRVGGHAPGHLLLYRPADGTLLSFDQFMDRLKTPLDLEEPDADPWGDYLASLEVARELEPSVLVSAHTAAVDSPGPWLARRRRALERSLERMADALADGAETARAVVGRVFARDPGEGRKALLVREVLAGLRHLASTGRARRRLEEGVERYRPA